MHDQKIDIQKHFKDRLNPVVACIKDKTNRDVGTSRAYDIMAAAQGIKDYQTAKGLADSPFYTLRCNVGKKDEPMWLTENLGYVDPNEVNEQAQSIIHKCQVPLEWTLFSNEQPTNVTYTSKPECEISKVLNHLLADFRQIDPTWDAAKMAEEFYVSPSTFNRWRKNFDDHAMSISFMERLHSLTLKLHKLKAKKEASR